MSGKPEWDGASNVQPRRVVRPTPAPWSCECAEIHPRPLQARLNPGYLARCPDCRQERPS